MDVDNEKISNGGYRRHTKGGRQNYQDFFFN